MPVELIVVIVAVLIVFSLVMAMLSRVKSAPPTRSWSFTVRSARTRTGSSRARSVSTAARPFVPPLVQSYQYLDLTPISIQVDLTNALSRQNIRIDVLLASRSVSRPSRGLCRIAAERLLGLQLSEIQELSKDIIFGQLRHHRHDGHRGDQHRPR